MYVFPEYYQDRKDLLWIHFDAKELISQKGYARGSNSITTGKDLGQWKFLAPLEISEEVAHEWGDYEGMGARIAEKVGGIVKGIKEGAGIIGAGKGAFNTIKNKKGFDPIAIAKTAAVTAAGHDIEKQKVDTAFTYQGTRRRTFSFNFQVAYMPGDKDVYESIHRPLQELKKYSCPQVDGDIIGIKFPAIFKLYSYPSQMLRVNHAALKGVQITWKAPYIGGYACHGDVLLTFTDIEPLYRKSFESGGIIKTSESTSKRGGIGGV